VPNIPLSGLTRIHDFSELLFEPDLISVSCPPNDRFLSQSLVLKKGQFYARYYSFDGYQRRSRVQYSITKTFPPKIWSFRGCVVVLSVSEGGRTDDLLQALGRSDNEQLAFLLLRQLTKERFDCVLRERDDWQFELIKWPEYPQIITILLYNVPQHFLLAANVAGDAAGVFIEECVSSLKRIPLTASALHHAIRLLIQVLPFESPGEGVPVVNL
jgi:hypothetical protein